MPAFIVRACAPCVSRLVSSCQLRFLYDIALDIVMLDETPLRPVTRERGGRGAGGCRLRFARLRAGRILLNCNSFVSQSIMQSILESIQRLQSG